MGALIATSCKKVAKLYHAISMESNTTPQCALALVDIRSNENVGSLFRTADAVGIEKIYLVGYTPAPIDRFGRPVGAITKTALGAEKTIQWEKVETVEALLEILQKDRYQSVAIEQSRKSIDYKKILVRYPIMFILGNEVDGLPESLLEQVETIAEIPMKGRKESLNVAVAGGVALFRMLDR